MGYSYGLNGSMVARRAVRRNGGAAGSKAVAARIGMRGRYALLRVHWRRTSECRSNQRRIPNRNGLQSCSNAHHDATRQLSLSKHAICFRKQASKKSERRIQAEIVAVRQVVQRARNGR